MPHFRVFQSLLSSSAPLHLGNTLRFYQELLLLRPPRAPSNPLWYSQALQSSSSPPKTLRNPSGSFNRCSPLRLLYTLEIL
nr:unnamed protein product [Haemonchus contortus]